MKLAALLLLIMSWAGCRAGATPSVKILHTNDLHSHLEGTGPDHYFTPTVGDGDGVRGHFARLMHLTRAQRSPSSVLVDSGDFYAGTLFHSLAPVEGLGFPEFEYFQKAQYDAVTLGNHEFDVGEEGLSILLNKVKSMGMWDRLVVSNLDQPRGIFAEIHTYLIKELPEGVRVGFLGALGPDGARMSAPFRKAVKFVGYDDRRDKAKWDALHYHLERQVHWLKKEKKVDLVILLLHGGLEEDERLAKISGLDVVAGGHTHDAYEKPRRTPGNAVRIQSGAYGSHLGRLVLSRQALGWKVEESSGLLPVDDSVEAEKDILHWVQMQKNALKPLLGPLGFSYDSPVGKIHRNQERGRGANDPYGRFLASGILRELNRKLALEVDVYFTSLGLIRENLRLHEEKPTLMQFSDVFRIFPIGFGPDFSPGSPLVHFWLTQKEWKTVMELLEAYRHLSPSYTAVYSDTLRYDLRGWGIPLWNRIREPLLHGKDLGTDSLIHLATNRYVANYFPRVSAMSYGLVDIKPRDSKGKVLPAPLPLSVTEAQLLALALGRGDADTSEKPTQTSAVNLR